MSPDLAAVLRTAQGLARRTGGAFDVSVGPLTALWRASRRAGRLPAPEVLRRARGSTGWERVQVRPRRDLVRFAASGVLLDLGGIAKGYAAQEALAVLRAHGFERAMVDAGGDLALGAPPPGRAGWRIGLSPFGREGAPAEAYLDLRGVGVATSGDRYRALVVDGVRYSHLLDPRTGLGVTHRIEVTVIAADAMAADALASAVSVLGWDAGYALLRRTPGAEGILRRRGEGGEVEERRTPGFTALLAPR